MRTGTAPAALLDRTTVEDPTIRQPLVLGENDFTTKTLGLLAFRPDLKERLVRRLVGDDAIASGAPVSLLGWLSRGDL